MAIREADCENCGETIYTANGKAWYHVSSRRWYCGDSVPIWDRLITVLGAIPAAGTELARKGADA